MPQEINGNPSPPGANIRRGEPPTFDELARRENLTEVEKLRREMETFIRLQQAEEKTRLLERRRHVLSELATIDNAIEKIEPSFKARQLEKFVRDLTAEQVESVKRLLARFRSRG